MLNGVGAGTAAAAAWALWTLPEVGGAVVTVVTAAAHGWIGGIAAAAIGLALCIADRAVPGWSRRSATPSRLDMAAISASGLAILIAAVGTTWNLRGLIATELDDAAASTNSRLENAVADIRRDLRAGRTNSDREMARILEIRGENDDGAAEKVPD